MKAGDLKLRDVGSRFTRVIGGIFQKLSNGLILREEVILCEFMKTSH